MLDDHTGNGLLDTSSCLAMLLVIVAVLHVCSYNPANNEVSLQDLVSDVLLTHTVSQGSQNQNAAFS